MAGTRKPGFLWQIRLINECRQSGMTDADFCRENDIIEVAMKDITVRLSNDANPGLLAGTFRLLQEPSC